MTKMSWFSLESIQNWGVPTEVDGTGLKLHQAKVLVGMVEDLMDDAKFAKKEAVEHALAAFRLMYERNNGEWVAHRTINLKGHGVAVRNKYYRQDHRERIMARVRVEIAERRKLNEAARNVLEAGRRNSGKDKAAIGTALDKLFDVLNKDDQEGLFKSMGKKLGRNVRFRRKPE